MSNTRIPMGRRSAQPLIKEFADLMRTRELKCREGRRQVLLNELALCEETISPEEVRLLRSLKRRDKEIRTRVYGGYFSRLFRALLGRC